MKKFDALLLPGVRMAEGGKAPEEMIARVDKACEVWSNAGRPRIVACGADAAGVGVSEAEAMKRLLIRRGVPAESILTEDTSMVTAENFRNAARFVGSGSHCALVTSDYHMARARLLARRAGLRVTGFRAKSPRGCRSFGRYVMEVLGMLDALFGWQDEGRRRPAFAEKLKRFLSRHLLKNTGA